MRPFNEVLREAQQHRPAVETSVTTSISGRKRGVRVVNPENITANPFSSGSTSTGGSSSRVRGFGDPKYYDGGKLKPDAYLQYQRSIALGPLNRPGVRASDYPDWPDPNPRLKEIDRVAAAGAAGDKDAQARLARWQQEFDAYKAKQAVPGRQTRTRTSAQGRAADAKFFRDLDTPQNIAAAEQQFAMDYKKDLDSGKTTLGGKPLSPKRARINRTGLRDLALAVDKVDKTPSQVIANTKQTQKITQAKAEVPKITPGKTKAGTGLYPPPIKDTPAPAPADPAKSKPGPVAAPRPQRPTTRSVAPRASTSTTNAAAASAKSFRRMARVGGLFATGVTIKNVRDQALASGAGRRRADLEGLAAGIGGSLASTAAIAAATPTGPVGQAVAGTAAFQPGADFARGIVRKLAGKPGDAVTKQSVLKNIKSTYREVVPQSVRQNVPKSLKKTFTDFYNQAVPFAHKVYKGYRRFERVSDLTGGNNK